MIHKKNLPGLRKFTYREMLRRSHLPSLELRRLHADLVWCYEILLASLGGFFFVPTTCASIREVNSTNYLRSPMFHAHGQTSLVNVS